MLRAFSIRIVVPTLLTVLLFVGALFLFFIPAFERAMMAQKREMIRELTLSAWNILANLEAEARAGLMTPEEARQQAILQVRNLHYGPEMKDYFWINDMRPVMIVHPYRPDLEGQDLSAITDPRGKYLFLEFVDTVRRQGEGFVAYRWQWKDDPSRIVPKLSFVRGFQPWGWIIGTGVYLEDVRHETARTSRRLALASAGILGIVSLLLSAIVIESLRSERRRTTAEDALRVSEERYRALVESAGESLIMALGDGGLFANASAVRMLGHTPEELDGMRLADILELPPGTDLETLTAPTETESAAEPAASRRLEGALRRRDGTCLPVLLSFSPIQVRDRKGVAVVATDISEQKGRRDEGEGREQALRRRVEVLEGLESRHRTAIEELRTALVLLDHPRAETAPAHLFQQIRAASSAKEVAAANGRFPLLVKVLVETGGEAENVGRFVAANTDVVLAALLRNLLAQLGPPPVPFAFLVMGSEGRREQTLCTDQDNALLFADPPPERERETETYFATLGESVCTWLDAAGYRLCEGNMMARNPAWRKPLSAWKTLFQNWIRGAEPEELLRTKIFFDFRSAYGDSTLVEELRDFLRRELDANPAFFGLLATDVLQYAPPVGLFGGIQVTRAEDGRKGFDIKSAMTPIVDFARIYALRHGIDATNTIERLRTLAKREILPARNADEIIQVYTALMQIRIQHQVHCIANAHPADNFVQPDDLTGVERRMVRECFAQIKAFQTRLGYNFTGMPGRT
ncbi:MAG: cache domain-containing protein [Lentisphaeria bacterium]|nr:cache domain-containing protein [Lentisphaeria bacterium]